MNNQKILVLGASGMLGSAVVRVFCSSAEFDVFASVRTATAKSYFSNLKNLNFVENIDIENHDSLVQLFMTVKPDVVINCIGIVKQLQSASDPLVTLPINSMLPHRLAHMCTLTSSRLIHISTDCVFSGSKGLYTESDQPDASDLYGISKFIGEVDYQNSITLRTSIIGHELKGARSLISWFLAQTGSVKGFTRAVFSGLPTVELARVIRDFVIPNEQLRGLYHVSVNPISKYELLKLVSETYHFDIEIVKDDSLVIDRSLDSSRFKIATGFSAKPWNVLINEMYDFN